MSKYLLINRGSQGWGTGLKIEIDPQKIIMSMTGRGIDPLAQKIADIAGVKVIDGFKDAAPDNQILLAVVNCGGTLRCGVYPQKGIPTINLNAIGPSGPLASFINEENYISGVEIEFVKAIDDVPSSEEVKMNVVTDREPIKAERPATVSQSKADDDNFFIRFVGNVGIILGKVISLAFESAKEALNIVMTTVIPFMIFIGVLVTLIIQSGVGDFVANAMKPLAGSLVGLIVISIICGIPFLSPLLGPGAAIAQVVGVLLGTQIAMGNIPPQYALPALFAINVQVGADFVPVGLSMQQAEPDTIKYGTPAFLISRQFTGPLAVIIAYLFSFGLF